MTLKGETVRIRFMRGEENNSGSGERLKMSGIHTVNDAKRYIERVCAELETFSEGGPVAAMLSGTPESEVTAAILRRALGERAVIVDAAGIAGADEPLYERILAVWAFWKRYAAEHGPTAYCFGVTEDALERWDRAAEASGADAGGSGLFPRRYEALRGVSAAELPLLAAALKEDR